MYQPDPGVITRFTPLTVVWKKIIVFADISVLKFNKCIEHGGELICSFDEIADILATLYAQISGSDICHHDFLERKYGVEQDLDFETEDDWTYSTPLPMWKLQCSIRAAGDTAAGPYSILYGIIPRLLVIAMAMLLTIITSSGRKWT